MKGRAVAVGCALSMLMSAAQGAEPRAGSTTVAAADEEAFLEFLGSFSDEDGDWLDALALEPFLPARGEPASGAAQRIAEDSAEQSTPTSGAAQNDRHGDDDDRQNDDGEPRTESDNHDLR